MIPRYLLPPAAYLDAGWLARERAAVLTPRWGLVGTEEQLSDAGDYVAATVGLAPLVVVRDEQGRLGAFHNLCRHRGMVLLQGAGNVSRTINCFYHQWRYALDGALEVVPQRREQFPGMDLADWALHPASVDVWEGMVFAHPHPDAPALRDALAGVTEHLGSHRPGLLREVARDRIEARCNWKLFVENHIDVYHLWYLHEGTLGDYEHRAFEYHEVGRNWASYEPLRSTRLSDATLTSGTVVIEHLEDRDRLGLGAHLVFPNLLIATAAEFFATYVPEPVAPDRTIIDLRIRAEEGADDAALLGALRSFILEDVAACEAVQVAVGSPAFAVGPLARGHEQPIASFHSSVLSAMGEP